MIPPPETAPLAQPSATQLLTDPAVARWLALQLQLTLSAILPTILQTITQYVCSSQPRGICRYQDRCRYRPFYRYVHLDQCPAKSVYNPPPANNQSDAASSSFRPKPTQHVQNRPPLPRTPLFINCMLVLPLREMPTNNWGILYGLTPRTRRNFLMPRSKTMKQESHRWFPTQINVSVRPQVTALPPKENPMIQTRNSLCVLPPVIRIQKSQRRHCQIQGSESTYASPADSGKGKLQLRISRMKVSVHRETSNQSPGFQVLHHHLLYVHRPWRPLPHGMF